MKNIIALVTCSYAHKGEPWLPTVHLIEGRTYPVTLDAKVENGVTPAIANKAIDSGRAEEVKVEEEEITSPEAVSNEDFDPRAATHDEMKTFVRADKDLDSLLDLRVGEDELRSDLIALLEEGTE